MSNAFAIHSPQLATWGTRCALALLVGVSFAIVGHKILRSQVMVDERYIESDRMENRFAVQQEDTTSRSAVGFFLLGGTGLACMATRPLGRPRWTHAVTFLCAAYFVWCSASLMWSAGPEVSVRKIGILTLMLTGAYGIAHKFEVEDVCWLAVLMFGTLLVIGYLAEFALGTFRPWRGEYRFCGTVHPNDQGVQCGLLVLAAWLAPWEATRRPWIGKALIAAGLVGLMLSKSRTALFALVAAAAVGAVLRFRGQRRVLAVAGLASILALGAIGYGFLSFGAIDATADVASMGRRQDVSSLTGRIPLWEALLHAADDRPVMGYGYGGFWTSKRILTYSQMFAWQIPHAHNAYLDLLLNVGVIGLVAYLSWMLGGAGTALARFQRSNRSAELFVVCLVVFSLVSGMAESKFPEPASGAFVLFLALATLAMRGGSAALAPTATNVQGSARFRSVEFGVGRHARPLAH